VAEALIERDIQSSLDPYVETAIVKNEEEDKMLDTLFFDVPAEQPQPQSLKPATAAAVSANVASSSGRENELQMTPPPGIDDYGEITDQEMYDQYLNDIETQSSVRREEININPSQHHDLDEPGGYL
jgi:hypothetical protein